MQSASKYELIVSEGERHIFEKVLAAIFFSVTAFVLLRCIYYAATLSPVNALEDLFFVLDKGLYCIAGGLYFSVTKTVLIDIDKDKLISRFHLGPFYRDRHSAIPKLEYVSVFLDGKSLFQVNLWYKGNRHYKMYVFEEKAPAMEFGRKVAEKLNLDLLDATVKNDSKWIDLSGQQSKTN